MGKGDKDYETHKDLDIWKRGIEFVENIYKSTIYSFDESSILPFNYLTT